MIQLNGQHFAVAASVSGDAVLNKDWELDILCRAQKRAIIHMRLMEVIDILEKLDPKDDRLSQSEKYMVQQVQSFTCKDYDD
jgi:hypothetical protein